MNENKDEEITGSFRALENSKSTKLANDELKVKKKNVTFALTLECKDLIVKLQEEKIFRMKDISVSQADILEEAVEMLAKKRKISV